ncbi:hypothetical protein TRFO_18515 [Tritrichomonas foetus]|uniref:Uncharacterized protein n=1 Tax=Tritrichomonas foetus TaxID=1144522 RepID=A0A1J4KKL8_9EUKA|nr:hypothetical protein TRFO_18515 [Tritrichomonas foetus]|eukprot:OHT11839.1 hypothetical protein TRFO_18515 [Tritrichomonas foetus]
MSSDIKFESLQIQKTPDLFLFPGKQIRDSFRDKHLFGKYNVLCKYDPKAKSSTIKTDSLETLAQILSEICNQSITAELIQSRLQNSSQGKSQKIPETPSQPQKSPQQPSQNPSQQPSQPPSEKPSQKPSQKPSEKSQKSAAESNEAEEFMKNVYYWEDASKIALIDNINLRDIYRDHELYTKFNVGVRANGPNRSKNITFICSSDKSVVCRIFSNISGKEITEEIFNKFLKSGPPQANNFKPATIASVSETPQKNTSNQSKVNKEDETKVNVNDEAEKVVKETATPNIPKIDIKVENNSTQKVENVTENEEITKSQPIQPQPQPQPPQPVQEPDQVEKKGAYYENGKIYLNQESYNEILALLGIYKASKPIKQIKFATH